MITQQQTENVSLDQLVLSDLNYRTTYDEVSIAELAENIRANGLLNPIGVVEVEVEGEPSLEVLVGSRRMKAYEYLLDTTGESQYESIPSFRLTFTGTEDEVRDKMLSVILSENIQRKDPHPLEEALAISHLRELGKTIEEISFMLHKSPAYLHRRIQLNSLIDPAKDSYRDNNMQLGHALLISRLRETDQAKVFKWLCGGVGHAAYTVRRTKEHITNSILLELSNAPWSKRSKTLVPEAGACNVCTKNTNVSVDLFGDIVKGSHCTDRKCWMQKKSAHHDVQYEKYLKAIRGLGQEPMILCYGWPTDSENEKLKSKYGGAIIHSDEVEMNPEKGDEILVAFVANVEQYMVNDEKKLYSIVNIKVLEKTEASVVKMFSSDDYFRDLRNHNNSTLSGLEWKLKSTKRDLSFSMAMFVLSCIDEGVINEQMLYNQLLPSHISLMKGYWSQLELKENVSKETYAEDVASYFENTFMEDRVTNMSSPRYDNRIAHMFMNCFREGKYHFIEEMFNMAMKSYTTGIDNNAKMFLISHYMKKPIVESLDYPLGVDFESITENLYSEAPELEYYLQDSSGEEE